MSRQLHFHIWRLRRTALRTDTPVARIACSATRAGPNQANKFFAHSLCGGRELFLQNACAFVLATQGDKAYNDGDQKAKQSKTTQASAEDQCALRTTTAENVNLGVWRHGCESKKAPRAEHEQSWATAKQSRNDREDNRRLPFHVFLLLNGILTARHDLAILPGTIPWKSQNDGKGERFTTPNSGRSADLTSFYKISSYLERLSPLTDGPESLCYGRSPHGPPSRGLLRRWAPRNDNLWRDRLESPSYGCLRSTPLFKTHASVECAAGDLRSPVQRRVGFQQVASRDDG